MKLTVLGGSGFVGRAVCREAVRRGWRVISLSRSGAPGVLDGLLGQVEWRKGSALDKDVYPSLLEGQDYIVHSIGILLESNPLYNLYKNQPVNYSSSYKALVRDTLELATEAAGPAGIKSFGYISAARYGALGKIVLPQYMAMKEEAEEILLRQKEYRKVIMRPGFMYGTDRWMTIPMSLGVTTTALFTGELLPRAICVDTVARATLNQLSDPGKDSTIMEVSDIRRIGSY